MTITMTQVVRFNRGSINFPNACARCGIHDPARKVTLSLPYQAWFRSNPKLDARVCWKCLVALRVADWALLIFSSAIAFFALRVSLPRIGLAIAHRYPNFTRTSGFSSAIEILAYALFIVVWYFLLDLGKRYMTPPQRLKIWITDYQEEWISLAASDPIYFAELQAISKLA
jgi:hypothetical protein